MFLPKLSDSMFAKIPWLVPSDILLPNLFIKSSGMSSNNRDIEVAPSSSNCFALLWSKV